MANIVDYEYKIMLTRILDNGEKRQDRTGVGTTGVFGYQMRLPLEQGFPLLTTKRVHFKSVVAELLWFLSGSTNNDDLKALGCSIWNEWADENGELGPIYGKQWRNFGERYCHDDTITRSLRFGAEFFYKAAVNFQGIDQIAQLISNLKSDPYSRRHVISAWNPVDLPDMALAPCHCLFQFFVSNDNKLSCHLYQRSADAFLGVPFNIASYALLTHLIAHVCGFKVGDFVHTFGDLHIYSNHMDAVNDQLERIPYDLPNLWLNPEVKDIFAFTMDDIRIENYNSHPSIKAEVAV